MHNQINRKITFNVLQQTGNIQVDLFFFTIILRYCVVIGDNQ